MSWTIKSGIKSSWSFALVSLITFCLSSLALGQTFPGSGVGDIPDGGPGCGPLGADLDITFAVTGMPSGAPSNVTVDLTASHSWVGDVRAELFAPDGTTSHVLFADTGSTTAAGCGSGDDLSGVLYKFDNTGTDDWWALGSPYPAGTYQTTTAGDSAGGGVASDMNAAFAGIADSNGTWTLRVNDGGAGDTGAVAVADLILVGGGVTPSGTTWNDYDGDGMSDYSVARDETPPSLRDNSNFPRSRAERLERMTRKPTAKSANLGAGGPGADIVWYNHRSGDSGADIAGHGTPATDFITPSDFDGDGQTDIAIWRSAPAGSAAYFILDSSTGTVRVELFGQTGDNSAVSGDYDGDGSADVAVYRCPAVAGQCTFFYRGTAGGGETTFVPWGNGTPFTLFPNTGDFDGDGKNDFCVQREDPATAGAGQFAVLRSSDFGATFVNWGTTTDLIVPGDYNGDGTSDFAITRNDGGQKTWYVLDGDSFGVLNYATPFGLNVDIEIPGDYDGDGSTDIAVWRQDAADQDNNYHYVLRSSDAAVSAFEWGNSGDFATANAQVQ